jgi:hypothetical protein
LTEIFSNMFVKEVQRFLSIDFPNTEDWESDEDDMEGDESGSDEEADDKEAGKKKEGQGAAHKKVSVLIKDGVQGKLVSPLSRAASRRV